MELSGKSISIIDSTHCISTIGLCSRRNDVNHNTEEALNSLGGQILISVHVGILGIFHWSSKSYLTHSSLFSSRVYQGD